MGPDPIDAITDPLNLTECKRQETTGLAMVTPSSLSNTLEGESVATQARRMSESFLEDEWPDLRCPVCRSALLRPGSKSLTTVLSSASEAERDHPDWEPDWIRGSFHGSVHCSDASCATPVMVTGDYEVGYADGPEQYGAFFRLRTAYPGPSLAPFSAFTPAEVLVRVVEAEAVALTDASAAAARLRTAVEALMTERKIRKTFLDKNGKRVRLSLHARIVEFAKQEPDISGLLLAVKWIGNEGSHDQAPLEWEEVVTGAELLAHAIKKLYDPSDKEMLRRARQVNLRKGVTKTRA